MGTDFNNSVVYSDKQITAEMLNETIHKADLFSQPNIVFVNPKDKDNLLKAVPDLTDRFLLEENTCIEQGKAIVVNRRELERWGKYD